MKKLVFTILLISSLGLLNLNAQGVGEAAPDFTVDLLSGSQFALEDHSGKVVMVYFFGNSCPYCLNSGADIETLFQTYNGNAKFSAVGLDTWDGSSNQESVSEFKTTTGITFPLAIKAGFVSTAYSTTYDRLLVINKEGQIAHKGTTAAGNDISTVSDAITAALNDEMTTNVDEQFVQEDILIIFPNPATDELRFQFGKKEKNFNSLSLFDISGKEVFSSLPETLGDNEYRLDVSEFPDGIYFYSLRGEEVNRTGKVVIR